MWWGQLTNQNLAQRCMEVHGGLWRCAEGCAEVCGGAWRCAEGCMEVRRGAWKFSKRWWGKNQDFLLIRFLNAGI